MKIGNRGSRSDNVKCLEIILDTRGNSEEERKQAKLRRSDHWIVVIYI
jgi:hypothetical protein